MQNSAFESEHFTQTVCFICIFSSIVDIALQVIWVIHTYYLLSYMLT